MKAIYEPKGMALEYSPRACNLYRGCTHGCTYCYAPSATYRKRSEFHAEATPRSGIIEAIKVEAPKLSRDKRVLLCFTCDPYQPCDDEHKLTQQAIKIFVDNGIPFQILTKGGMRAARDFDLYARGDGVFASTVSFLDDKDRAEWEPNAAPIAERLEALQAAYALGIPTWVSIEPVIDTRQALAIIERVTPFASEIKVGKLNHHPLAKTINWSQFAIAAYDALKATGRAYLIKDALAAYLPTGKQAQWPIPEPQNIEKPGSNVQTTLMLG